MRDWPSFAATLDTRPAGAFQAETETIALGAVNLSFGRYGSQDVARTTARIRGDERDHLAVTMVLAGRIAGDWGNIGPGQFGLCDLTLPFAHRSSDCELATVSLPRGLTTSRGLDPRALHGTVVGRAHSAMLRSHLFQIRAAAGVIAADDGPRLAGTVVDLLAVSLAAAGRAGALADGAPGRATRLRADQLINSCVDQPDLGPAFLCRELGVSRATLYRLFASEGGVQERIRNARLAAARRALLTPAVRIGDVAERFGFGDPAYFSRAFRAEYGVTPSEWRAQPPDLASTDQ